MINPVISNDSQVLLLQVGTGSISRAFKFSPEWLAYIGSEAAVVPSSEFSLENEVFKPVFFRSNRGEIPHNRYGRCQTVTELSTTAVPNEY